MRRFTSFDTSKRMRSVAPMLQTRKMASNLRHLLRSSRAKMYQALPLFILGSEVTCVKMELLYNTERESLGTSLAKTQHYAEIGQKCHRIGLTADNGLQTIGFISDHA